MKTAVKIFAAIGVVTALFSIAAVVIHIVCKENKKYYCYLHFLPLFYTKLQNTFYF